MIFENTIGLEATKIPVKTINRIAISAMIVKKYKLLMITNNTGDIKFPGGGLELDESLEEAIKREIEEETGYIVSDVKQLMGTVIERRADKFDEDYIFEWFPSTKTCNCCGHVLNELSLNIWQWDCPNGHTKDINRDINASNNILEQGIREMKDNVVA